MTVTTSSSVERIERLEQALQPYRESLLVHPVYERIADLDSLQTFMQYHVFAVWDFMSLLKKLQCELTCVEQPWLPSGDSHSCRFINEIVLGEESDEDGARGFASHFDLYLSAMKQLDASPHLIERLFQRLRQGKDVVAALHESDLPRSVVQFVTQTFDLIASNDLPAIASGFTYGREDLLPGVFQKIVASIGSKFDVSASRFLYYLERHIELDGDQHGPMAQRMLIQLCQDDDEKWQTAEDAARRCLEARILLWDGMQQAIGEPVL